MPSEETKILEFNQYQNSNKAPFIIHGDLECLREKIDGCKNNPENSYTTKVGKQMNSRTQIKTQKSAIFAKKNLKINMPLLKNVVKLGTLVTIQESIEVLNIVYVI